MTTPPTILARSGSWTRLSPQRNADTLFLSGADGSVRAFDAQDGQLQWKSPASEEADQFLVDDTLLVTSSPTGLSAVDVKDGAALWTYPRQLGLESLTGRSVLASRRGEVRSLAKDTGAVVWQTTSHEPLALWDNQVLTVGGERDRRETLEVRNSDTGAVAWSTTDGDIKHIVPNGETMLYGSTKFSRHHQEVQRVSCRDRSGSVRWEHRCAGELRSAPLFSPDGSRIALVQKSPVDPSTSVLTLLDAMSGEPYYQVPAFMETQVAFAGDGRLFLSETAFSEVSGEEQTRLRCLDSSGQTQWSRPQKPDWMTPEEQLLIAAGSRLSRLSVDSGLELWSIELGAPSAPVSCSDGQLIVNADGCRLVTVELSEGRVERVVGTGEKLFVGSQGHISDHTGLLWKDRIALSGSSPLVGRWESPDPFHIGMKASATQRNGLSSVFVDWDGDDTDDGTDPILLDSERKVISWVALQGRDHDGDLRLETEKLSDLSLWFDSDGDGRISSEAEINPLLSSAFDKARIDLDEDLLWLASDSRCAKK